uniref:ATP synthase protein 8 n=1 Tax=Heterodermia casarettiana TaxID=365009 RepID=A0A482JZ05_9LECA|nr:ATP synthase F0 subunit 8 [Heterodermia casarettiana]QBP39509.1 ATP synthase F0 subunit 8 [Heterodermia casarettiana]
MPQILPFFFINQVIFAFILLLVIIYVFSKYILPRFVRLFLTRVLISKL